jgi:hypothetical protein
MVNSSYLRLPIISRECLQNVHKQLKGLVCPEDLDYCSLNGHIRERITSIKIKLMIDKPLRTLEKHCNKQSSNIFDIRRDQVRGPKSCF